MSVLCYNKGCGQRFDPENNADDACQYHPGVPVFHDALKGWSCCKRRTTDFSDFLSIALLSEVRENAAASKSQRALSCRNSKYDRTAEEDHNTFENLGNAYGHLFIIVTEASSDRAAFPTDPRDVLHGQATHKKYIDTLHIAASSMTIGFSGVTGCTKGPHNQDKPAEPVKPEVKSSTDKTTNDLKPKFDECIIQAPKPIESIQRPSPDEPFSTLQQKISPSLKQALEKLKLTEENTQEVKEEDSDEVKIGTSCKNGGCSKTFSGPASDDETCLYHAGVPIFHEGMKYWSCCKRKTSDFNTFLSQEGCTSGKHQWKKKDTGKKVVPCRFDWHQTGSQVIISIYAKNSIPELSSVEGNSTLLKIHIIFEGEKEFEKQISFWGVIDTSKSLVNMMATKIEVVLKKAEPMSWARLDLPPVVPPKEEKKKDVDSEDECDN